MNNTKLAYVAGILDGEGSLLIKTFHKKTKHPYKMLVISMAITEITIRDFVAGQVEKFGLKCSKGSYQPKRPNCKLVYYVNINGRNAEQFYKLLSPYLLRLKLPEIK